MFINPLACKQNEHIAPLLIGDAPLVRKLPRDKLDIRSNRRQTLLGKIVRGKRTLKYKKSKEGHHGMEEREIGGIKGQK